MRMIYSYFLKFSILEAKGTFFLEWINLVYQFIHFIISSLNVFLYLFVTRDLYLSKKVKLATIVEGNPKAPFSIATTPRCRGGRYSFPGLLYFTLDPYLIMLSVKQRGIKYHFLSLWYDSTWDWTQVSRAIGEHSNRWSNVLSFFFFLHLFIVVTFLILIIY